MKGDMFPHVAYSSFKELNMAFEPGNEIWRLRGLNGRPTLPKDPESLRQMAIDYFSWSVDNPILEQDFQGGYEITRIHPRPFNIKGFATFFGACESWWRGFKQSHAVLKDPDFLAVIGWIEDTMFNQKFEGAAVGLFKENLISRELGLRDQMNMDHTSKGKALLPVIANMTIEELKMLRDGGPEGTEEDIRSGD